MIAYNYFSNEVICWDYYKNPQDKLSDYKDLNEIIKYYTYSTNGTAIFKDCIKYIHAKGAVTLIISIYQDYEEIGCFVLKPMNGNYVEILDNERYLVNVIDYYQKLYQRNYMIDKLLDV